MAEVSRDKLSTNMSTHNGRTPTPEAGPLTASPELDPWKIMLVDDDSYNQRMIKLFLKDFEFEGKPLEIYSAYSGAEAMTLIRQHPDTALMLLDMVMEELDSGLKVAQYVRNQANNHLIRIVMLTGQSYSASEQEIVTEYDINDYKVKTDFSRQKLTTTVMASLRSYRDLVTLEAHRQKLAILSDNLAAQTAELARANRELEQKNTRLENEIRERINTERALQDSEERYRTLVENSPDVLFRYDQAHRHIYVSQNVVKIFGREAADFLGKTHAELGFSEAETKAWATKIQRVLDTAEPQEEECIDDGPNGQHILNWRLIPEFGPAGTVESVLGIARDISDRKQMEAELESLLDAEHEQRLLSDTMSEAALAFSSQMSQADVLNEILRQMGRLVAYRHAHIMLLKDNTLKIACWHGYNEAEASARIAGLVQNLDDFPMDARVIRTREPIVIEDTYNTPGWVVQPETAWVKSHLTVPVCLSDTVLGLLRMDSHVTGAFTADDVQRLQPLARAAAIALQNANLYDQAQQEIAERRQAEEALTESAARYHTIFEESPISLWEEDFSQVKAYLDELRAGGVDDFADYFSRHPEAVTRCADLIQILDVNRATLELFGAASKKELLQGLPQVFTDESLRVFKQEILALIQGATEYTSENVRKALGGNLIAVTVHLSIAPGYEESWEKVFVSVVDITALKTSQEIFRRYEFIVNASQELMTLIDSNYKYMAASDAYCRAHNKPRKKIVGKTVAQLWGKVRFEGRLKYVLDRCFAGESIQYERWIEFGKLGKRRVEVTYYPYQSSSQGRVTHVVVVSRDITAYRQAEAALRQAHADTERLLTSIPLALIGINGQNVVTHWNGPAEVTFDVPRSDALGQCLSDGLVAWNWEKIESGLAACRDKGHPIDMPDVRYTRSDEKEAFLKITATPFVAKTSGAGGLLLLVQDITERKVLEGQLAQAQKLEAVGQLAAGIAHEINTPTQYIGDNVGFLQSALSKLTGAFEQYAQLLAAAKTGPVPTEQIDALEKITRTARVEYLLAELPLAAEEAMDGVERVSQIVKAMKEFSHPGVEEKTSININRAIQSTITVARNEWKYVANLTTDFAPDLPPVPCLPGEFNQVILNILINAAHAITEANGPDSAEKGDIIVSTRRDDDWVVIKISDTGTGIPKEVQSKIFDPFFTTKEVGRGTGQGLAISHSVIAEKHGGTISVQSTPGHGSTFTIRLPLHSLPHPTEAQYA